MRYAVSFSPLSLLEGLKADQQARGKAQLEKVVIKSG